MTDTTTTRYRCTVCGAIRATLESAQAHVAKKHAHGVAGLLDRRTTRSGVEVGLYDGLAAGMDTDGGRWQTVCEKHGWVISHTTKALAVRFLPVPEEWCEKCAGTEPE